MICQACQLNQTNTIEAPMYPECEADYLKLVRCSQALLDAEQNGWQTRYDGTAFCPNHTLQKGHQK